MRASTQLSRAFSTSHPASKVSAAPWKKQPVAALFSATERVTILRRLFRKFPQLQESLMARESRLLLETEFVRGKEQKQRPALACQATRLRGWRRQRRFCLFDSWDLNRKRAGCYRRHDSGVNRYWLGRASESGFVCSATNRVDAAQGRHLNSVGHGTTAPSRHRPDRFEIIGGRRVLIA